VRLIVGGKQVGQGNGSAGGAERGLRKWRQRSAVTTHGRSTSHAFGEEWAERALQPWMSRADQS